MIFMGDSINNFIDLLTRGDFFLIFLIIMMVIIIGVIVYLVRLQIHDTDYYDKYDDEDDEEEDYIVPEKVIREVEEPIKVEPIKVISNSISTDNLEALSEEINSDLEELEEDIDSFKDEDIIEDAVMALENPEPIKEISPIRKVEQSRFNFEDESTINSIKSFEEEQEENAIISASELDSRINELKESGEYEEHERQLHEYEQEQEIKAIISYDELLNRAKESSVCYESEENIGGIHVGKVDTSNIDHYSETNDKPYYKEESFLEAMKEFRRAL